MMWMYIRNGARSDHSSIGDNFQQGKSKMIFFLQIRTPEDVEILDMTTLLPELRDRIAAAADVSFTMTQLRFERHPSLHKLFLNMWDNATKLLSAYSAL